MNNLEFQKVAVIGSGFMGSGIAQVTATAGVDVVIHDNRPEAARKALETIGWSLEKLKSKGKLGAEPEDVLKRILFAESLDEVAEAELVIEAVYESIPVKQELLEKLNGIVGKDAVVASNTSSIPMVELSEKVSNPERFIGMHFFGPVPLMGLVEVVMGPETSEETLERVKSFVKHIGKSSIVVRKPSPGFIVNRIFNAAAAEAMRLWAEGVGTPQDIDTGMRLGYGWVAGPFEVLDNAGIDIMAGVLEVLGLEPPEQIQEMIKKGHLGRKTGQGFYKYGPDGKKISD